MRSVWTRRRFLFALGSTALGLVSPVRLRGDEEKTRQPNVLFIALADLNDWTKVPDANAPIRTPNIAMIIKNIPTSGTMWLPIPEIQESSIA